MFQNKNSGEDRYGSPHRRSPVLIPVRGKTGKLRLPRIPALIVFFFFSGIQTRDSPKLSYRKSSPHFRCKSSGSLDWALPEKTGLRLRKESGVKRSSPASFRIQASSSLPARTAPAQPPAEPARSRTSAAGAARIRGRWRQGSLVASGQVSGSRMWTLEGVDPGLRGVGEVRWRLSGLSTTSAVAAAERTSAPFRRCRWKNSTEN